MKISNTEFNTTISNADEMIEVFEMHSHGYLVEVIRVTNGESFKFIVRGGLLASKVDRFDCYNVTCIGSNSEVAEASAQCFEFETLSVAQDKAIALLSTDLQTVFER